MFSCSASRAWTFQHSRVRVTSTLVGGEFEIGFESKELKTQKITNTASSLLCDLFFFSRQRRKILFHGVKQLRRLFLFSFFFNCFSLFNFVDNSIYVFYFFFSSKTKYDVASYYRLSEPIVSP